MTLNGFHYPDDADAFETGQLDFERGNGQNPWSRGTIEAIGWRNGYKFSVEAFEAMLNRAA